MAVIGGFRSDLSITRKTDWNFGNVSTGVCFPKSRINENGGKTLSWKWTSINFARNRSLFLDQGGTVWDWIKHRSLKKRNKTAVSKTEKIDIFMFVPVSRERNSLVFKSVLFFISKNDPKHFLVVLWNISKRTKLSRLIFLILQQL